MMDKTYRTFNEELPQDDTQFIDFYIHDNTEKRGKSEGERNRWGVTCNKGP